MAGEPKLKRGNLFAALPATAAEEDFLTLFAGGDCRLQRIVSHQHASPPGFWYEQAEDEWVVVLQGEAELAFDGGECLRLGVGDWVEIPAGCRHRVHRTAAATIWLALYCTPATAG